MNTNLVDKKEYNLLLSILLLSLFVTIKYETSLVLIKPFDLICLIVFPLVFILKTKEEAINKGFFYLIPFFIIHALSGLMVGFNNFLREFLQILMMIIFAFTLSTFKTRIDCQKLFNNVFLGSLIIMLGVIWWHYSTGLWGRGWKDLTDSKTIFTIITILIFIYIIFFKKIKFNELYLLFFILFPILLMSGERKALLIFVLLFFIKYSPGFTIKTVYILFFTFLFLNFLSNYVENSYVQTKISTTLNFMETGNLDYFLNTGFISENDTISNLQRAFSFNVSLGYFTNNPFFGIGTNNYVRMVVEQYPALVLFRSGALVHGIHGEFLRVLVENGLIGFIAYLMIWYKSWNRSRILLDEIKKIGIINKEQFNFCLYGIYLSLAIYVGTEASSTRSLMFLTFISLLPDYYAYHFGLKKNNLKK